MPGTDVFLRAIDAIAASITTGGNQLQILKNGDEIPPVMLEAINEAKSTINLLTYIYWTGPIAVEVAPALTERAGAGKVPLSFGTVSGQAFLHHAFQGSFTFGFQRFGRAFAVVGSLYPEIWNEEYNQHRYQ